MLVDILKYQIHTLLQTFGHNRTILFSNYLFNYFFQNKNTNYNSISSLNIEQLQQTENLTGGWFSFLSRGPLLLARLFKDGKVVENMFSNIKSEFLLLFRVSRT